MAEFSELPAAGILTGNLTDRVCVQVESGALLAHPTTSVYGLGGRGPQSDLRVSRMKGRSGSIPVIRLVSDARGLRDACPAIAWTERAELLASAFWPGPLTLVLDDGSERGMAVRAEAHPVTRAVLERCAGTLGSTSLNRTGAGPVRTAAEARETLESMPDPGVPVLFLEAGNLPGPPTSTLLSLLHDEPRLLREGAIERRRIEEVLGCPLSG